MQEAAIDLGLAHYLEARALEIALSKASDADLQNRLERLTGLRAELMEQREAVTRQFVELRHARGEFYSDAKVKSINSMGPSREELDRSVRDRYEARAGAVDVLKAHARVHFGQGLVSQRSQLALMTPDIAGIARSALRREEVFAAEWCAVIADPSFRAELAALRREALKLFRDPSTPMILTCTPASDARGGELDDALLGRAWGKLDAACTARDVPALSTFAGLDGPLEAEAFGAHEILPSVSALIEAMQDGSLKASPRKALLGTLVQVRGVLVAQGEREGRAYFAAGF